MKEKKNQKLVLSKETVASLELTDLNIIRGGEVTFDCDTDKGDCWPDTDVSWPPCL